MNSGEAFAAILTGVFFGFLVTTWICLNAMKGTHTEQDIVDNTQACFYLDEDHERKFSWDCSEKDEK